MNYCALHTTVNILALHHVDAVSLLLYQHSSQRSKRSPVCIYEVPVTLATSVQEYGRRLPQVFENRTLVRSHQ